MARGTPKFRAPKWHLPTGVGFKDGRRYALWVRWQELGLPLPNPQTGRTGILKAAIHHFEKRKRERLGGS